MGGNSNYKAKASSRAEARRRWVI